MAIILAYWAFTWVAVPLCLVCTSPYLGSLKIDSVVRQFRPSAVMARYLKSAVAVGCNSVGRVKSNMFDESLFFVRI